METIHFRQAQFEDLSLIWEIIEDAIERRKNDGSKQWQDGYPNIPTLKNDIQTHSGFVIELKGSIVGYVALIVNEEPAYHKIEGKWLSNHEFIVFHRLAIATSVIGRGLGNTIMLYVENWAIENGIRSIRADTNFDNAIMLHLFQKNGFIRCGKVFFRGDERIAFEKMLV